MPNIRPEGPVDFILIAMEPSTGGGQKDTQQGQKNSNFARSTEDFILHFCIKEHLCRDDQSYYLTDLSKGAMKNEKAGTDRQERYEAWYPLLQRELRLVAKPGARIIAIGNVVAGFLADKHLCERVERVLHYSPSAAGHRDKAIQQWEEHFAAFSRTIDTNAFEGAINAVFRQIYRDALTGEDLDKFIQTRMGDHSHVPKLLQSESRKKLAFYYKNRFQELQSAPHIVLDPNGLKARDEGHAITLRKSGPIVKFAIGDKVRVQQSARAKGFRGRIGTVLQADVPGKGTQVEVNGVRKWMSSRSLDAARDLDR